MNSSSDPIEKMQHCINSLEAPVASELNNALNEVRVHLAKQEEKTNQQGEAQASAIVHSAEIISELEETKEYLEKSRLETEAAMMQAKELSAFGDILEHSLNEIYIFDSETFHFVHVNHGAQKNIGYSMEDLQEMTPLDIKPNDTSSSFEELVSPLLNGTDESVGFTTIHRRKDGSDYPVQVQLELSTLHGKLVFAAIIRDLTEQKKIEDELKNITLSQEDTIERFGKTVRELEHTHYKLKDAYKEIKKATHVNNGEKV